MMDKTTLSKCQGVKIRPENGVARGWFSQIRDEHLVMPTIDLDGVSDAGAMFLGSLVKQFKGFTNCGSLEQASRMFSGCKSLVGKIDVLDSCTKLKQATRMFYSCST